MMMMIPGELFKPLIPPEIANMIKRDSSSLLLLRNPSTKKICTSCCTVGGVSAVRCFACGIWSYIVGSAVDFGNGHVGIPASVGVVAGDYIKIVETVSYDGSYWVISNVGGLVVIDRGVYHAEVFGVDSQMHKGELLPNKITADFDLVGCSCYYQSYEHSVEFTKLADVSGVYEVGDPENRDDDSAGWLMCHYEVEGEFASPIEFGAYYPYPITDCSGAPQYVKELTHYQIYVNIVHEYKGVNKGRTSMAVVFNGKTISDSGYAVDVFQHQSVIDKNSCFGGDDFQELEGTKENTCTSSIYDWWWGAMDNASMASIARGGVE